MSVFELAAVLLALSAGFGWVNHRYLRLPHTIGLLVMGLVASLLLVLLHFFFPDAELYTDLTTALLDIDFTDVVMNGMLAFLLFAGALNVDFSALRRRAWRILTLALVGTLISTAIIGVGFWLAAMAIGYPMPLAWALVFGALISPTDPVAVLSTLKTIAVPEDLAAEVEGEALFNDGIAIVVFTILLQFAAGSNHGEISAGEVAYHLIFEAGGGLILGTVTGFIAYRAMRAIDDFPVEVLITLALVAGTYALAQHLAMSGPLAVVAAGLIIGERGTRYAMSATTSGYVSALWTLIDEVLNSVLFLLIGLEVLVLRFDPPAVVLAILAVPLAVVARLVAVTVPLVSLLFGTALSVRNIPFLTWAAVRGGISVALALSLPDSAAKPAILAATYAVVLFTIVVQGGTLGIVARWTIGSGGGRTEAPAADEGGRKALPE